VVTVIKPMSSECYEVSEWLVIKKVEILLRHQLTKLML